VASKDASSTNVAFFFVDEVGMVALACDVYANGSDTGAW
jgi:hypothetical protein